MNKKDKLMEATSMALQGKLMESMSGRLLDFKVKELTKSNLEKDMDKEKAEDTLEAYNKFKEIAYDLVDVPYNIQNLAIQGMDECYVYLCKLLGVNRLD